jgi:hypothetical protein
MPMEHDCAPITAAEEACCVIDARAPRPPATFTLISSFRPTVGVAAAIAPPVFHLSYESSRVAYRREMLKIPLDTTYVRTSRFLL